jgi:hypothetical protein
MMNDLFRVEGFITVQVMDGDGKVKRRPPPDRWYAFFYFLRDWSFSRFLKKKPILIGAIPAMGRLMEQRSPHILTREWAVLIADALLNAGGSMQVGTGWRENKIEAGTRCHVPVAETHGLDAGYPAWDGGFGTDEKTTITYRATFPERSLNAAGINEVCLVSGSTAERGCLAYARIAPVDLSVGDTLRLSWEITVGADEENLPPPGHGGGVFRRR